MTLVLLLGACGQTPDTPAEPSPPESVQGVPVSQQGMKWSDPKTWEKLNQSVPTAGSTVTIPAGQTVLLDIDTPDLKGIFVNGTLNVAEAYTDANTNGALDVRAGFVMVHGKLRAGTEQHPHQGRVVVTLTGTANTDVTGMNMGAKVLGVMGGQLELHGRSLTSWVRLNQTASPGSSVLTLDQPVNWRPGDQLLITMTGGMHHAGHYVWNTANWASMHENEVVTVKSVSGNVVTLESPLTFQHYGQMQTFEGFTVDQRAEVALLTRDIRIQGDETSAGTQFGGHVMVMNSGSARVANVEFKHMGQMGVMGRYAMHWHQNGDSSGQYLKSSSIHDNFNRFLSVHATDNVLLEDNVGYHTFGHGFMLEDGAERGNTFRRNLGVLIRPAPPERRLLASDATPSAFWITNPDNTFIDNVAASSTGHGLWVALPSVPTGLSANRTDLNPSTTPLRTFQGNRSHSNGMTGLFIDANPDEKTFSGGHRPPVPALYEDFQSNNDFSAVWLGGNNLRRARPGIADQSRLSTHRAPGSVIHDGVFIGRTANSRRVTSYGKMPQLLGTATYGGRVVLQDMTFINYPTSEPGVAAIELEEHNELVQDKDYLRNLRFVNANPVWVSVPPPTSNPVGNNAQALRDRTGTITGTPGRSLVPKHAAITLTSNCTLHDAWNAYLCSERYKTVGVHSTGNDQPLFISRDDGVVQQEVNGHFPLISGRRYTVTTPGTLPTSYWQVGVHASEPGDVFRVALPLASAPSVVKRRYFSSNFRAAGSIAEVEADSKGELYFYDAVTRSLHLKFVHIPGLGGGHYLYEIR